MNDQPNYIIFKLYRNSRFSIFSYLKHRNPNHYVYPIIDQYEKIIKSIDDLAKKHNRKMVFTSSFGDNDTNFFVNTPYLEVLYNGELPQEEKELYILMAKKLFSDGDSILDPSEEYTPELVVHFSKLPADDFFRVIPESNLDKRLDKRLDNLDIVSPVKY